MQSSNSVIVEVWEAIDGDVPRMRATARGQLYFFICIFFFHKEILEEI